MHISMLGTRGVPAAYSGFETAVEEVGRRLVERGHRITVYCRYPGQTMTSYLGMETVNLPALRMKTAETLSHTAVSVLHLQKSPPDVALVFNAANAPLLPLLRARTVPTAVHVDGLEWKRAKWGPNGRRYYLAAERLSVRWADDLIADARAIQDYYRETYDAESTYIAYGAPLVDADPGFAGLAGLGLISRGYHLVVARFEPENNVDVIIEGYELSTCRLPLVVVGSAPYSHDYVARVNDLAGRDERVRLVGSVWDQALLDQLYANAATYIHGQSVGGTNPSLLRAMGAGSPVIAIEVPFTREVLAETGRFFADPTALAAELEAAEGAGAETARRGQRGRERAAANYDWDAVTEGYEALCARLHAERGARRVGRRGR
jgi:glycosyltransferase involved in cell wall biosynthesis